MQITPEDWRDLLMRLDRTERLSARAAIAAEFAAAGLVVVGIFLATLWFNGYFQHA